MDRNRAPRTPGIRTLIAALARAGGNGRGRTRRGSVLVIAVGALALLAVIVASYVLVGRSDATTANIASATSTVDETVRRASDYFAKIIGDDALSVFLEYDGNSNLPVLTREAWDYPATPYGARSYSLQSGQLTPNDGEIAFHPSGTLPSDVDVLSDLDPQTVAPFAASDPWLASTEPVFLNPDGDPWTDPDYLDRKDWLHISNVAPDGRFVNLFNLRNNFNAEPGVGLDDEGRGRMSAGLSLFQNEDTLYKQLVNDNTTTDSDLDFDNSIQADLTVPAHWDSRQRFLFRPAGNGPFGPADKRFLPSQFADADGDGFYDSRWVELVRVADPTASSSDLQAEWILPRNGDWRWFFGVRIVDLSSLLNVNTATDITGTDNAPGPPPNNTGDERYPAGVSPADIDLRQILTMASPFDQYQEALVNADQQDKLPKSLRKTAVDYLDRGLDATVAFDAGAEGYADLRQSIADGVVPPPNVADYGGVGGGGGGAPDDPILNPEGRYAHYRDRAAVFGEAILDDTSGSLSLSTGGLFELGDLVELLTYHGRNDDAATTRLERALDGRDWPANAWFGPLRSNRPLLVERGLVDTLENDGLGDFLPDDDDLLLYNTDVRRLLTTVSGAARRRSWTYGPLDTSAGGGPPFITTMDFLGLPTQIATGGLRSFAIPAMLGESAPADAPVPAIGALDLATPNLPGVSAQEMETRTRPLFRAYLEALAPFLKRPDPLSVWHDGSTARATDTLFYGNHPLRALLAAAHMTASAVDMYDDDLALVDGAPTKGSAAYTLDLSWDAPTGLTTEFPFPRLNPLEEQPTQKNAPPYLPPSASALPPGLGQMGAVNVFGVDTQPFLTEVATYFIYTDAPDDNDSTTGWADDDTSTDIDGDGFGDEPLEITIWGDVLEESDDFVAQVVAFQLANPFDEEISLDDYTLQYGAFRFTFADGATIPPGGWTVGWAISEDEIDQLDELDPPLTQEQFESVVDDLVAGTDTGIDGSVTKLTVSSEDIYGEAVDTTFVDFTDETSVNAGDEHLLKMALLWRDTGEDGLATDDLLADRLRQENPDAEPILNARLSNPGSNEISGTDGTNDNPFPDDFGYSFISWAYIRRPSDINETPAGALPAWCIETRWRDVSLNSDADEDTSALSKTDFTSGAANFDTLLTTLLAGIDGADIVDGPEMHLDPESKTGNPIGGNIDGVAYSSLYPEAHLDNERFRFTDADNKSVVRMRKTDMLLPLAVGAIEDPAWGETGMSSTGNDADDFDREWTTLGESLAMALHYDDVTLATVPAPFAFEDLHEHFDRGQLRIDRFVPFLDQDTNGEYDAGSDPPRGLGVPLALTILDVFDTSPWGSIRTPAYGLVNVNTAPASVLRMLPLLSPTTTDEWWYDTTHDERSDIAAHLVAYRDKLYVQPRAMNGSPSTDPPLDYSDTTGDQAGQQQTVPPAGVVFEDMTPEDPTDATSRLYRTEVFAIREEPGFASLGELAIVRDRRQTAGVAYPAPHDMDRLAFNELSNTNSDAVDSIVYDDPNGTGTTTGDGITDDYDEQLTILSAVANVASVRSDFYAVWFVMHGYRRGDVEGLGSSDVMRPSVARRYLMIVDRSGVARAGDTPRILLLREVPL